MERRRAQWPVLQEGRPAPGTHPDDHDDETGGGKPARAHLGDQRLLRRDGLRRLRRPPSGTGPGPITTLWPAATLTAISEKPCCRRSEIASTSSYRSPRAARDPMGRTLTPASVRRPRWGHVEGRSCWAVRSPYRSRLTCRPRCPNTLDDRYVLTLLDSMPPTLLQPERNKRWILFAK